MVYAWPPTLADAKAHLSDIGTANDAQVQAYIDAVTPVIENVVGPVNSTTYTEARDGGGAVITLRRYPVLSVTSVTEYDWTGSGQVLTAQPFGSTYDSFGYILDAEIGVLRRTNGGSLWQFVSGTANVVVVYAAGRAAVPANVWLAHLLTLQSLWQGEQQIGRPAAGGSPNAPDEPFTVAGESSMMLAPDVLELLAPYRRAPRSA